MTPAILSCEQFSESIQGVKISAMSRSEDGMQACLELEDGRILVFQGEFVIFIGSIEKQVIH